MKVQTSPVGYRVATMARESWQPQDLSEAQNLGILEIAGDTFHVLLTGNHTTLVFGSPTNSIFLQSGYIKIEPDESVNDALNELYEDLTIYSDGPQYVSRIVCNERM